MSLLNFEERKIFLKNNYNKNQKKTYNKNMRKNNQKKIFLGMGQETHSSSNSSSQNKVLSPTLRNAVKGKNKNTGNENKNLKEIDQFNLIQKLNKKKKEENNYKHNKSFEENAINNNILLQYKIESPLIPGNNMDNCGNEILEILNLDINNNNKSKNLSKKKLNNSYILQSKFKSMINDNNNIRNTHEKNNNYSNNIYNNNINRSKLDDDIDKVNEYNDIYKNKTIYIIHYPKGKEVIWMKKIIIWLI